MAQITKTLYFAVLTLWSVTQCAILPNPMSTSGSEIVDLSLPPTSSGALLTAPASSALTPLAAVAAAAAAAGSSGSDDTIKDVVDDMVSKANDAVSAVAEVTSEAVEKITDAVSEAVSGTSDVKERISDVKERISDAKEQISDAKEAATEVMSDAVEKITEASSDAVDDMLDVVQDAAEDAEEILQDANSAPDADITHEILDHIDDFDESMDDSTTSDDDSASDSSDDVSSVLDLVSDFTDEMGLGSQSDGGDDSNNSDDDNSFSEVVEELPSFFGGNDNDVDSSSDDDSSSSMMSNAFSRENEIDDKLESMVRPSTWFQYLLKHDEPDTSSEGGKSGSVSLNRYLGKMSRVRGMMDVLEARLAGATAVSSVDSFGLRPLSCRRSGGHLPRHAALNDIVTCALDASGLHCILTPSGLDHSDGKRPDGLTIFPFEGGNCLMLDTNFSHSLSPQSIISSASAPGCIPKKAEGAKIRKYADLRNCFVDFVPVAVETSDALGPFTTQFLQKVGRRLANAIKGDRREINATGDQREMGWLFARTSLAIVRGNAFSILTAPLAHK
ncbi:dentin sialophosphoprotein [Aplysia californica]|uniref:Dentin sialophosphoprotein n=1 Tax=Aplysia californica TaxID=6500 RepID=A0ABM0K8X4_APLCA|nr:dentin sialophosphoprotein [Aplysia californica]